MYELYYTHPSDPNKDIFEDGFKTKAQAYDWIMSLIPNKDTDCVHIKRSRN